MALGGGLARDANLMTEADLRVRRHDGKEGNEQGYVGQMHGGRSVGGAKLEVQAIRQAYIEVCRKIFV